MKATELVPLRAGIAIPQGDLAPLNCSMGEGESPLPAATAEQLAQVSIVKRAQWPSIRVTDGGRAETGPTGNPWVNANGWLVQMVRARDNKEVWLDTKPQNNSRPESLALAVADAAAYGGRWIVTPTSGGWPAIQNALRFFERRRAQQAWKAVARLAVISDFKGANESIGGEYLNLLARRQIPFHLLTSIAERGDVRAIVWLDRKPIPESELAKLMPWIKEGGLLIAPPQSRTGASNEEHSHLMFNEGKGRIAVALKPWNDPYQAAAQTHLLMSRRNDTLRLWNGGSLNAHYVEAPDSRRALVHLVNYAVREASHAVTVWTAKSYRSASLTHLDGRTEKLKPSVVNNGIEMALPPVGVYAAIELEA